MFPKMAVTDAPETARGERATRTPLPRLLLPSLRQRGGAFARSGWQRIRHLTTEQYLWIAVIALGALTRFWGLGDKPLHHDESMHAFYSLLFARDPSTYAYDPLLHGPFQFHIEGIAIALILAAQHLFGVGGAAGNPWLNDTTARFAPALFGLGIVALPLGLRRELGRAGALIAALLLAVSPTFVYFSRFLREDIYFNFFMFAMVVCAVRFAQKRTTGWFVGMFLMAVLAYATFEGFFLMLAIAGSFLVVLAVWELAHGVERLLPRVLSERERTFFSRALLLLALATAGASAALLGLRKLAELSAYINKEPDKSLAQVRQLENTSVAVLLYVSIIIALVVITVLIWQLVRDVAPAAAFEGAGDADTFGEEEDEIPMATRPLVERIERAALAPARGITRLRARLDTEHQPFLLLLLRIHWVQWFVAFVLSWILFAALFWIIPGPSRPITLGQGFSQGVGSGLWQGLYYWLQQQQIARGGQPWYYYLMLIPLYEQLAVVFGLAGIAYALARPTRFRLFLAWWFVASLGLYSWAGEKMPWLTIHILLSLMLLAGLALDWVVRQCIAHAAPLFSLVRARMAAPTAALAETRAGPPAETRAELLTSERASAESSAGDETPVRADGAARDIRALAAARRAQRDVRRRGIAGLVGVVGVVGAILLLIPMVHSMLILTQQDAANGPREMMVYVQTTDDVDRVMNKITAADQALSGGKHQLRIGVGQGEEWPMYWYLRDYSLDPHPLTYVTWAYDVNNKQAPQQDVLILLPSDAQAFMALHPTGYRMKQYKLRSWFDEAYKPLPCVATKSRPCPTSASWGSGVGLPNFLSYGSNPPPNAKFDLGRATSRLWAWLWVRQPLGDTRGSYDFTFVVRDGLPIQP
ncbi:MAG: glycosyltransferase family 39 protein [Ktedonobacterales bacterium]|nr:glycosyltransferase family 39 protein [Ktedonobacterales bacterium]